MGRRRQAPVRRRKLQGRREDSGAARKRTRLAAYAPELQNGPLTLT